MSRSPVDWTGIRAIHERQQNAMSVSQSLDLMFPYKDWRDDPDEVRGQAQKVLEKALKV